ncbi:MAG: exo-alpha-sialidase [Euryarchaeota archaeon]|nr:exo-alpha-sialidase [Euryarchaeota archaeon]
MRLPRTFPAAFVALVTLASGCLGGQTPSGTGDGEASVRGPATHVLADALEPHDLEAPAFKLRGTMAKGGAVIGGGEPSIWAHLDGTLYIAYPGCDKGLEGSATFTGCLHGPVYRSDDQGATWKRLNRESDGRLSDKGPNANGDNDVAVDANGTVYASNLGAGGIQVWRSFDRGATWSYIGNATPRRTGADRQWMAAAGPGHLIVTYMQTSPQRVVAVNTTFDYGGNWTGIRKAGNQIGWLGSVQFAPDGRTAYIPYTEYGGPSGLFGQLFGPAPFDVRFMRTTDGGRTWTNGTTGSIVTRSGTGGHWSGVLMAPSLDVTGDGTVVYAWSEEANDPMQLTSLGSRIRYVVSKDQGETWSRPIELLPGPVPMQRIMPWVTGGAGDRFAITYFQSPVPGDADYVGAWDVVATVVEDAAPGARTVTTVIEPRVHLGGLCARGGTCLLTASDRTLLDFFEADLMPDGRLAVTYPADPVEGAKAIEIRFAIQDGGTPLLVRP